MSIGIVCMVRAANITNSTKSSAACPGVESPSDSSPRVSISVHLLWWKHFLRVETSCGATKRY